MATVADLRSGRTQDELTDELNRLIKSVQETGKSGKLVLTLNVKKLSKDNSLVQIDDSVAVSAPKPSRAATLMYADDDGNVSLDDPNAKRTGALKGVDQEPRTLREIGNVN